MALKAAIIALSLTLTLAGQARAATVTAVSGEVSGLKCNFRLDGNIQSGDLAKLAATRAQVEDLISAHLGNNASMAEMWGSNSPILCLNSRGGNFSEGLQIAKYLMTSAMVSTYVEDLAECYSACALIFLAGRIFDRGGETYPARFLHVGGRLGFHAPYVEPSMLEDRAYSRAEVAKAFKAAISGVTDAIQLFDARTFGGPKMHHDNRPWVSASLFIEMLRKGENEVLAIDTVGKAGRWGIELVGVKELNVLNANAFRQACDNVSAWEGDQVGGEEPRYEALPSSDADFKHFSRLQGASVFRIQGMRRTYFCLVKPRFGPQRRFEGLTVKLVRDWLAMNPGATTFHGYEVPRWAAAFPANAPLGNLRP